MKEFQAYPRCKYHNTGKITTVRNPDEEAALGGGWANSPGEFARYQARQALLDHDPVKWVDPWPVEGLSESHRNKIKARFHRVHAFYSKSPDAPNAGTDAMRLAFDGVARVLFDADFLTPQHLEREIPQLVWDSAIAGGWWLLASETRLDMFPEKLGHYWVWRDNSRDWNMLFTAEAAEWRASILEDPASVSEPPETPKAQARRKRIDAPTPPRTQRWEDIEIEFLSEERVQIWIVGHPETRNYAEMGFQDHRKGTPNKSWDVLALLAQENGKISVTGRQAGGWAAIEKRIERTRKLLQCHFGFGISEDPLPFKKGVGYQLRCKIRRAPSFDA